MAQNQSVNSGSGSHNAPPSHGTRGSRHITRPSCGARGSYRLGDGRRKCRWCGKKFTPRRRTGKPDDATLRELVRLFWLMVPAERVARDLGLNRKTVQAHFRRLRETIAEESRQALAQIGGEVEVDESYFGGVRKGKRGRGAGGKIPVFGLLKRGGEVRVVFPNRVDRANLKGAIKNPVQPQSWVYSDSFRAYDRLDVEGFHHVRIDHGQTFGTGRAHINGIENFWSFAKRRLKLYHGGYKKNFRLFMREMAFRFNHRDDPNVVEHLYYLLKAGPD